MERAPVGKPPDRVQIGSTRVEVADISREIFDKPLRGLRIWAYSAGTVARLAPPTALRRIRVWDEACLGPIYKDGILPPFIGYDNVLYHTRCTVAIHYRLNGRTRSRTEAAKLQRCNNKSSV